MTRFKVEFPFYQAQYHQLHIGESTKLYDGNTFLVFNEYLHILAEIGCIVSILLLLTLGIIWKNKNASTECSIAFYGIICLMFFGIFSYPLSILSIKTLLILFIAIIGKRSKQLFKRDNINIKKYSLLPITSLIVVFSIFASYIIYDWDSSKQQNHYSFRQNTDYSKFAFLFRDNIHFIRHQYHTAINDGDSLQALAILNDAIKRVPVYGFYRQRADLYYELGEHIEAEKEYQFLMHLAPSQLGPALRLAMIYKETGNTNKAMKLISSYLTIDPKEVDLNTRAILYEMKLIYHELECRKRHHPAI